MKIKLLLVGLLVWGMAGAQTQPFNGIDMT